MPTVFVNTPGVQINEVRLGSPPIIGVGTSTAGFVGAAPKTGQFTSVARLVTSADQFSADYIVDATTSTPLSRAVLGFFANGGTTCYVVNVDSTTASNIVTGLKLLEVIDEIAIIAAPGHTSSTVYQELEDQATRTGTAVCDDDCELYSVPSAKILELFYQVMDKGLLEDSDYGQVVIRVRAAGVPVIWHVLYPSVAPPIRRLHAALADLGTPACASA